MLPTVKYPDSRLSSTCEPVAVFDSELHKLLDDMAETMKAESGIGLAANQVGVSKRIFVMTDTHGKLWEFINPAIVDRDGFTTINEGCLSAPGVFVQVPRSEVVTVVAMNRNGVEFKIVAQGIEAVCVQHELDHLDGIFFLEKTSRNQRRQALRQLGLK